MTPESVGCWRTAASLDDAIRVIGLAPHSTPDLQRMRFFFASSAAFHRQLTGLYDMIHPTAAAMWNLRWQVKGYVDERPDTSKNELHGRFVAGSGIGSANLVRHCVENSWEEQQSELALLALYAGISLYEGWVAGLELGTARERKMLQFPSGGSAGGAGAVVSRHQASPSAVVDRIYGATLRSGSRYLPGRREDLLLAYRCFKEARNSSAHAGRVANDIAERAYMNARDEVSGLGARGRQLSLPRLIESQEVVVTLQDVQALWAIMLSLVATLDADLAVTTAGEAALISRWKAVHPFRMLSSDTTRRQRQIIRMNTVAGLPHPSDPEELFDFLRAERMVI